MSDCMQELRHINSARKMENYRRQEGRGPSCGSWAVGFKKSL